MNLPDAIKAYFETEKTGDAGGLDAAFAPTAIVRDEGETHRGAEAIRLWWHAAKRKYGHTAEPVSASADGSRVTVLATVSGNFPGSPADLRFRFVLQQDRISELEIGQ